MLFEELNINKNIVQGLKEIGLKELEDKELGGKLVELALKGAPAAPFGFDENNDGVIDLTTETFPSTGGNDKPNPLGLGAIPDNNENA